MFRLAEARTEGRTRRGRRSPSPPPPLSPHRDPGPRRVRAEFVRGAGARPGALVRCRGLHVDAPRSLGLTDLRNPLLALARSRERAAKPPSRTGWGFGGFAA